MVEGLQRTPFILVLTAMAKKKKKPFGTFQGKDYTYPELYASLFGVDLPLRDYALDRIRIVEDYKDSLKCRSEFCRYFSSVELKRGQKFVPNCKSWRCEKCRLAWGRKWSALISDQLERTPPTLLVNLTTSKMIDFQILENALRRFMVNFRAWFGPSEYVKVVEYNRRKTQPHFHLIMCCKEYKPRPMPKGWEPEKSWPPEDFQFIKYIWEDALAFYNPEAPATTVVWNQPPLNGPAATAYAVGYVTGKSLDKGEEPDSTWKGRKITKSNGFFSTLTSILWERILQRWFPDRPKDPVFGLIINEDECEQSGIPYHLLTEQVKAKLSLTSYWHDNGAEPPGTNPEVEFSYLEDSNQMIFEAEPEPEKVAYRKTFNQNRTRKAIDEMLPDGACTRLWSAYPRYPGGGGESASPAKEG